jgi:hypothetical protein
MVMHDLSSTTSSAPVPVAISPVIQVEDAAVDLGGRSIWQHVQLSVQPGEFLFREAHRAWSFRTARQCRDRLRPAAAAF